jgi:hypothetical protein
MAHLAIDKPIQQGPSDLTREERLVGGDRSDGADQITSCVRRIIIEGLHHDR